MANKHLSNRPHHHENRQDIWWYEEPGGVCIISHHLPNGKRFSIPWRSIRAALARKDKPQDG